MPITLDVNQKRIKLAIAELLVQVVVSSKPTCLSQMTVHTNCTTLPLSVNHSAQLIPHHNSLWSARNKEKTITKRNTDHTVNNDIYNNETSSTDNI